jgi:hypothetical protein
MLAALANADMYLHNPPGSNDRCRERNNNRNNGNRLFDSQNNAQGGYPWRGNGCIRHEPDPLEYYVGSRLRLEWTNQHACGQNDNVNCETIVQYACEDTLPSLRDGYPSGALVEGDSNNDGYCHATYQFNNADDDITNGNSNNRNTCTDTIPFRTSDQNGKLPDMVDSDENNQRGGKSCTGFGDVMKQASNPFTSVDQLWQPLADCEYFYPDASGMNGDVVSATQINSPQAGMEFGMHEGPLYYGYMCAYAARNTGLYHADQNLQRDDRSSTRQDANGDDPENDNNNGGGRNGLECPEERDYYPYWSPTPFKDVVVFTTRLDHCSYFQQTSHNVAAVGFCSCGVDCRTEANKLGNRNQNNPEGQEQNDEYLVPWDKDICAQAGGNWIEQANNGVETAPDCLPHPLTRDNHLGAAYPVKNDGTVNVDLALEQPETAFYDWEIPEHILDSVGDKQKGQLCIVRFRYNISTADYRGTVVHNGGTFDSEGTSTSFFTNEEDCTNRVTRIRNDNNEERRENYPQCDQTNFGPGNYPVGINRPYVMWEGKWDDGKDADDNLIQVFDEDGNPLPGQDESQFFLMSIALNSNQAGRTFQDRSHVFRVKERPSSDAVEGLSGSSVIWNLNTRGRRGNIVQTYPSVEYDYVPSVLEMNRGDFVHIQFHVSQYNTARNANNGEGWQYCDGSNIMQLANKGANFPMPLSETTMWGEPSDSKVQAVAKRMAYLDQHEESTWEQNKFFQANDGNGIANEDAHCQYIDDNGNAPNANDIQNCAKLNAIPRNFNYLMQVDPVGSGRFYYVSTRNNNFSNRSHKGMWIVNDPLSAGAIAGIVIGAVAGAALLFAGWNYGGKHPDSIAGKLFCRRGAGATRV